MKLPLIVLALLVPLPVWAVTILGQRTAPDQWTYDLTFAPLDNYSIFQSDTTITLRGLFGAFAAAGPISTDFESALDGINRDWNAEVIDGGTGVRWSHVGGGTGNFSVEKHIFGFRVFANGAVDGLVSLTTSGFSRDQGNPLPDDTYDLDINALVSGPVRIPEAHTAALLGCALVPLFARQRKRPTA